MTMNAISSSYYYDEIGRCLQRIQGNARQCSTTAYRLFVEVLNEATAGAGVSFTGPFSKLHFLCTHLQVPTTDYTLLNDFRVRMRESRSLTEEDLVRRLPTDLLLLAQWVSRLKEAPIPDDLLKKLPHRVPTEVHSQPAQEVCVRMVVTKVGENLRVRPVESTPARDYQLRWLSSDGKGDFSGLKTLVQSGQLLNLLHPVYDGEEISAELLVVEPDFLLDVTSVAACFQPFGVSADLYPIRRLLPIRNTPHILLGNFASQLLDEAVHHRRSSYVESTRRFFAQHALQLATCTDLENINARRTFHKEAKAQQQHLYHLVNNVFHQELHMDATDSVWLEPSFFCEKLGLQGRMDLLSHDRKTVIEQKSGKKDFRTRGAVEQHHVQMILYLAMLHYGLGIPYSHLQAYLLYSKYEEAEAMIRVENVPVLLREAMRVRNEIVLREMQFARTGIDDFMEAFTPEQVHLRECGKLWESYQLPELRGFTEVFHTADPLTKSYFYRFHRFLTLEQELSKLGSPTREASGFAAAWQCNGEEKRRAGTILAPLFLDAMMWENETNHEVREITLTTDGNETGDENLYTPNFRVGDIVVLYAYNQEQEPDLRAGIVFRASVKAMTENKMVLRLRAAQTDVRTLQLRPGQAWAVEPDFMEASAGTLFRGLYTFLTGNSNRRDLLLGRRRASVDLSRQPLLKVKNEEIRHLMIKVVQARDLFLLVGPPGTGKTSFGLMSILREELSEKGKNVLLGAFTNRAVDEICSKLVAAGIDFIRLGNTLSCDQVFSKYLIEDKTNIASNVRNIRALVSETRVWVGTVTSISATEELFALKTFSLAIIDEASQLPEPHLLPLLMAQHESQPAIERFVLIGDHKQLPAVVQQSEVDSCVAEPELQAIGLTNCRRSLFERLIAMLPENCVYRFTKQGRMHPEVAHFAGYHFYDDTLVPVPLPHQLEEIESPRVVFYDCPPEEETGADGPKTNLAEAMLITQLAIEEWQKAEQAGRDADVAHDLGIIVPYRHQISLIQRQLRASRYPQLADVTIDTVERFQGTEREMIIYGFTVKNQFQLNFLCSSCFVDEKGVLIDRKLNVALTRARQRTLMVGNRKLLETVPLLKALIAEAAVGKAPTTQS